MRTFYEKGFWILFLGLSIILLNFSFFNYEIPEAFFGGWVGLLILGFGYFVISQRLFLFVVKRLGEAIFVLWVIASVTFLTLRWVPGGPFDQEKALPPEVKANIEAKYNLNGTLLSQYTDYMGGLLHGDLGESYKYVGRNVLDIISDSCWPSFQLGLYALILSFLIGIPAGILAASRHNSWFDHLIMLSAIGGVSLPSFLVAPLLILFFSLYLDLLPPAFWEGPSYYLLPVVTLGTRPAAVIARLTRSSVLEVIQSDFVRTAKAKGLSPSKVLFKHVLKNSLIPVLTFSGPLVAGVLSGSFVIEFIFAIPGMGKHIIQSVNNRDYPLILGMTLIFSALLVIANLIVDLLYSYFDPRIRLT